MRTGYLRHNRVGKRYITMPLTEKQIQNIIYRKYGADKRMMLWRQNTGVGEYTDSTGQKRKVRFGLPGQADLSGLLKGGIRLEIEVKTAKGTQSQKQKWFQKRIKELGGIYILARCIEDVDQVIDRYFNS